MKSETMSAPGCTKTFVSKLVEEEGLQIMKVTVESGGEIPLHSHECAATMVVLSGTARALGNNERTVRKGDVVVKQPKEPHGFCDIQEPFSFISISDNRGIVRSDGWDITYMN